MLCAFPAARRAEQWKQVFPGFPYLQNSGISLLKPRFDRLATENMDMKVIALLFMLWIPILSMADHEGLFRDLGI